VNGADSPLAAMLELQRAHRALQHVRNHGHPPRTHAAKIRAAIGHTKKRKDNGE